MRSIRAWCAAALAVVMVSFSTAAQASSIRPAHRKWCNVVENGAVVKQVPLGTRQTLENGEVQQCVHGRWESVVTSQPASEVSHTAVYLASASVLLLLVALAFAIQRRKRLSKSDSVNDSDR